MERYIVGKCRSGKQVTSDPTRDNLKSLEEIFDAIVMLDVLAAREYRSFGDSENVQTLLEGIESLKKILTTKSTYKTQMEVIGAKTSLDLRRYAQTLLAAEFRD